MKATLAPLMTSDDGTWRTPELVLDLARQLSPTGRISLDTATSPDNPTKADAFYTPEDDGLAQTWRTVHGGLTWCNPPYGRGITPWVKAGAWAGLARQPVLMLLPARTDTAWWQDYVAKADAICFWRGRLKFSGHKAAAPFPSALPYWGAQVDKFVELFSPHGWVVRNT